RNVLAPLGLEALEPLAYVLLVASLGYAIATALTTGTHPLLIKAGKHARDQILSCVLCAVALSAARSDFSVLEASAAGLSGALGWWCAAILLDRIVERLETEDVPPALAGVPLRLISAGLLAMAFSGVDRILVSRLVG
ncbi:MAG TPA: Rnf-Nqr domain containing protein, partial [Magnetospirillaceae bacterium]|nr:Rnf-Nqr domain containing protein [Magnetospirillaceae bacterium]